MKFNSIRISNRINNNNKKNNKFDNKQQILFLETAIKWHRHETHAAIASLNEIQFH